MMNVIVRDATQNGWMHFQGLREIVVAHHIAEVLPGLRRIEQQVERVGLYAAGFIAYEAAPAFDAALRVRPSGGDLPLLWFGLYETIDTRPRLPQAPATACPPDHWQPSLAQGDYLPAIAAIKKYIARGDTYQVNFTFHLRSSFEGDPWACFLQLQRAQEAPYAAYLDIGSHAICSVSPELFFSLDGDSLLSRPMKGTAPRGRTLAEDEANRAWLHNSAKNRAENVMIVDMIRNDVGRIAATGSVHVPGLFEVERYPTVLQMTSSVRAQTGASFSDILTALFPCASITGAPKVSTMQIISELEQEPRGVYTGAIGYLLPGRKAQFNVAIRTLVIDKAAGRAEYGVGGGIVWDSVGPDEYRECEIKARVLASPPPRFSILESLLWEPTAGYFLLDRHLGRMVEAATYFTIPFDLPRVHEHLTQLAATLPPHPHKVRLLIDQEGVITVEATPLSSSTTDHPLQVGLATQPISPSDPFLFHKTTYRRLYERALAGRPECDDVLLWNEQGEITESTRANVVARLDGEWVTPPIACGLLGGTFRAQLLAQGAIREKVIRIEDLARADAIYLINSVRRWMPATWVDRPEPARSRR